MAKAKKEKMEANPFKLKKELPHLPGYIIVILWTAFGAHLLCDVAHLRVYIVEQAGKIGHNACRQDAFDPVGNGFKNGFHSAVTVLS